MAKLRDVAAFYISLAQDMADMELGDAMTNLRLQKMLYFSQGWMLARHGRPLFEDAIEAWQYGPVVPVCYNWYKGSGGNPLTAEMPSRDAFTDEEYELLFDAWNELSKYSTSQLVSMTHEAGTPWDTVWNHSKQREIGQEEIRRYFAGIQIASIREKLNSIPVAEPLCRREGVPVFDAGEAWANE